VEAAAAGGKQRRRAAVWSEWSRAAEARVPRRGVLVLEKAGG
jgi:hypothetical protein